MGKASMGISVAVAGEVLEHCRNAVFLKGGDFSPAVRKHLLQTAEGAVVKEAGILLGLHLHHRRQVHLDSQGP